MSNIVCFRLKTGETLYSFCKRNNISYVTVFCKIERGMSVDDAAEEALKNVFKRERNNCKYVLKNGKTLRSQCIENKVCTRSCYRLIKNGYTPDEALSKLIRKEMKK